MKSLSRDAIHRGINSITLTLCITIAQAATHMPEVQVPTVTGKADIEAIAAEIKSPRIKRNRIHLMC